MAVTVKEESLHHATEALILKSPRKYYHAFMHVDHWQLRSIISSPKARIIYYPNGPDVYRLDTSTREREYVATIPFTPKCLVAAGGWISCGGDNGNFATIHLLPREGLSGFGSGMNSEADSRLPLNLDPALRFNSEARPSLSIENRRANYLLLERSTTIGEELVNCITLWLPGCAPSEQIYKKPVAVLSSNDHSVSVVDLETRQTLDRLELDDCVNRATISPDGRLLIAIGDDPYMHIFERKQKSIENKRLFIPKTTHEFEWVKCRQLHLESQRSADKSEMRGSFAMSFAPSGRYLAAATQYGTISVFETASLTNLDADPLRVSFTTSRPNLRSGAVRAMEFSPEPYDLLAWTEHRGRVAVADIRQSFMSRQLMIMDPRGEGIETVAVIERTDDIVIDPRLRQFRIDPEGNTDSVAAEMERRQLRHLSREGLDRIHAPLTPEETEVLQALQHSRRQRERDNSRQSSASTSIHSPLVWSDLSDDFRSNREIGTTAQATSSALNEDIRTSWRASGLPASLREFVNGGRSNDSLRTETLRAFINERNQERERRGQTPRRRGSLILAAAGTALNRDLQESGDTQRSTTWDLAAGRERITLTPPRLPAIRSDSPSSNPWVEIEALYNLAVDPSVIDPATRMRIEVAAENRREFTRRLEQRARAYLPREELPSRLDHGESGASSSIPLEPAGTTGCCWSKDGKILYVGVEHGIYEYHVNIIGRKIFPSLAFR